MLPSPGPHPTPESLLPRSDSCNPSTTCRGINSTGRPCRRALARSSLSYDLDVERADDASLYCWQHKNQAGQNVISEQEENSKHKKRRKKQAGPNMLTPLQERNSIDTLVDRLGIASIKSSDNARPAQKSHSRPHRPIPPPNKPSNRPKKRPGLFATLCCMTGSDSSPNADYVELVRHQQRLSQHPANQQGRIHEMSQTAPGHRPPPRPTPARIHGVPPAHSSPAVLTTPHAPPLANTASKTLLDWIPRHLPPQTISALLTELSKPISKYDEPGYIYIFWLSNSPNAQLSDTTTSSRTLLAPPPSAQSSGERGSDILNKTLDENARASSVGQQKGKILLKVGRANNVHRRMNEWKSQCGYDLTLLRFYPYVSSSQPSTPQRAGAPRSLFPPLHHASPAAPSTNPPQNSRRASAPPSDTGLHHADGVRKVPHSHRVERLIHVELAGCRAREQGKCEVCGREHREWFEADGTREGVRAVDDVVRRWVRWAEGVERGL